GRAGPCRTGPTRRRSAAPAPLPAAPPRRPRPPRGRRRPGRAQAAPAPGRATPTSRPRPPRRPTHPARATPHTPGAGALSLLPLPLAQHHTPVRRSAGERLAQAVRPVYLDGVDVVGPSQAEVGARVVTAQVALSWVDEPRPGAAAGLHDQLGPVGIALQLRVDGLDQQPVPTLRCHIAVQAGPAPSRRRPQGDT